jgi:CHAD domain-containing protein
LIRVSSVSAKKISGQSPSVSLAHSLERALRRVRKKQGLATDGLAPEPVHDLRVALRRCRSLAEGFSELNPNGEWRHLRNACKKLLDGLAEVRDGQVVEEWTQRLGLTEGTLGATLTECLDAEQRQARHDARKVLADFSRKRWKRWRRSLPKRVACITAPEAHFARLALRRLAKAHALEERWQTHPSSKAAHRLRIGLKRFRYTIESFLPEEAAWSTELKKLQDMLGDIHDLDVLRQQVLRFSRAKAEEQQRMKWLAKIESVRAKAVRDYWREIVVKTAAGAETAHAQTLWDRWERGLSKLAGLTFPIHAELSASAARPASLAAWKSSRSPGRQRRLSSAR